LKRRQRVRRKIRKPGIEGKIHEAATDHNPYVA